MIMFFLYYIYIYIYICLPNQTNLNYDRITFLEETLQRKGLAHYSGTTATVALLDSAAAFIRTVFICIYILYSYLYLNVYTYFVPLYIWRPASSKILNPKFDILYIYMIIFCFVLHMYIFFC